MNQWAVKFANEDNSTENSREELISIEAEAQKIEALRQQISEAMMAEGIPAGDINVGDLSPQVQAELDEMSIELADKLIKMFNSGIDEEVLIEQFGDHISGVIGELTRNKAASKKLQKKMEELMSVIEAARQRLSSKIALDSRVSYNALQSLKMLNSLTSALNQNLQAQRLGKDAINLNQRESSRQSQNIALQLRQSLLKSLEAMRSIDARLKDMQKQLQNPEKLSERMIKQQLKAVREALKNATPEQQIALKAQQAQLRQQLAQAREQTLQRQLKSVQEAMKSAAPEHMAALRQQQNVLQQQLKANQQEQAMRQQMKSLQDAMRKATPEQQQALRQQLNQLKQQLNAQMREQAQLRQLNLQAKNGVLQARLNQLNEAMKTARPEQLQAMQRQQQLLQSKLSQNELRLNERALKSQMREINDSLKKASPEQRDALLQVQARIKAQLDANRQQQEAVRQQLNSTKQSDLQARLSRLNEAMKTASPDKLLAMQRQRQELVSKLTEAQLRNQISQINKELKTATPDRTAELQAQKSLLQKQMDVQKMVRETSKNPELNKILRSLTESRIGNMQAAKEAIALLEAAKSSNRPLTLSDAVLRTLENNIAKISEEANRTGDRQLIKDVLQLRNQINEAAKLDRSHSLKPELLTTHSNVRSMGQENETGFIQNMKKNFLESDALKAIKEKFGDKKPSSKCDNCDKTAGCCSGPKNLVEKFKQVVGHIKISKETPEKQAEIKDKITDQRKVDSVIKQGADKFKKGLSNFGGFLKNKRSELETSPDRNEVEAKQQEDASRRAKVSNKFGSGTNKPPASAKPNGPQIETGAEAGVGR